MLHSSTHQEPPSAASSEAVDEPAARTRLAGRIERHSMPVTESGCWVWLGCTMKAGYGQVSVNNKPVLAHRASWQAHRGPIPDGICVLHQCDVPACVNPDHLFLGTQLDNIADMNRKGRARGRHWENGKAKAA